MIFVTYVSLTWTKYFFRFQAQNPFYILVPDLSEFAWKSACFHNFFRKKGRRRLKPRFLFQKSCNIKDYKRLKTLQNRFTLRV